MPSSQWVFDHFRLDPDHACLWREAEAIVLPPKTFAVLHYLVTHPDRLVTKDELLDAVWPETAVRDAVVRVAIGALRKVLGDTAQTPRFIATVPRRGYRFLAPVAEHTGVAPVPAVPASPPHSRRHGGPPVRCHAAAGHPAAPRQTERSSAPCRRRRRNAAASRCCSVTWSTRPGWRGTWTRKTSGRWCAPTIRPVPR